MKLSGAWATPVERAQIALHLSPERPLKVSGL
ncbi:hypothetical protein GGP80_003332 [Salinibacter ruber]|nr:hypothetical protein [Salinibacter ruber]